MSRIVYVPPCVRISSSTLGSSSESMMCPCSSTSSTKPGAAGALVPVSVMTGTSWLLVRLPAVGLRHRPGTQHLGDERLGRLGERALLDGSDGVLDGVLDTLQLD